MDLQGKQKVPGVHKEVEEGGVAKEVGAVEVEEEADGVGGEEQGEEEEGAMDQMMIILIMTAKII